MSNTHRIMVAASAILSICTTVACGDDSRSEGSAESGGATTAGHQATRDPTSEPSPSGNFGQEPTATNQVLIGADFGGFRGHDFGRVTVGSRITKHFQAVKLGVVKSVRIAKVGTDSPQFQITRDACAGKKLTRGEKCSFSVTFEPDETGRLTGNVQIILEPRDIVGGSAMFGVGTTGGPEPTETSESTTDPTSPTEDTPPPPTSASLEGIDSGTA